MKSIKTVAIVPAAGMGRRLGLKTRKPFVLLGGRPLITYALETLNSSKSIDAIIIAAERTYIKRVKDLVHRYGFDKVIDVVAGGETRFESVEHCLRKVNDSFDMVMIHDGARPFLDERMIAGSIKMAHEYGACIMAMPENDTVKFAAAGSLVEKTLDRDKVFRAQTPQTFKAGVIKKAYALRHNRCVTDDASLVEQMGKPVKILKGSFKNIKITAKEDLKIAEALL